MSGTETTYLVKVDYSQSLQEMINAGKDDLVCMFKKVNQENFPFEGEGTHEVELVLFHQDMGRKLDMSRRITTEEVKEKLKEENLRPAFLPELVVFGIKYYPEFTRKFWIAALGSIWVHPTGVRYVPFLRGFKEDFKTEYGGLSLRSCDNDWFESWRFLAAKA